MVKDYDAVKGNEEFKLLSSEVQKNILERRVKYEKELFAKRKQEEELKDIVILYNKDLP